MTGLNASACPKRNAGMNVNSFKFCGPLCCGLLSSMYLCILQQLQSRSVCLWRWQGDCRCDVPMCFSCWPLSWRQIILYELWTMQNRRRPSGLGQIQSQPFWAELGAGALRFRHLLRVGDLLRYRSDHEALCNMLFQYQSIFGFYSIEIIQHRLFFLVSKTCECKIPRECSKDGKQMYCLKIVKLQSTRSLNLCFMAAMKCTKMEFELLHEGPCASP